MLSGSSDRVTGSVCKGYMYGRTWSLMFPMLMLCFVEETFRELVKEENVICIFMLQVSLCQFMT